jgi:hypothetical protein
MIEAQDLSGVHIDAAHLGDGIGEARLGDSAFRQALRRAVPAPRRAVPLVMRPLLPHARSPMRRSRRSTPEGEHAQGRSKPRASRGAVVGISIHGGAPSLRPANSLRSLRACDFFTRPQSLTTTIVPCALIAPCQAAGTWGSVQAKRKRASRGDRLTQPWLRGAPKPSCQ